MGVGWEGASPVNPGFIDAQGRRFRYSRCRLLPSVDHLLLLLLSLLLPLLMSMPACPTMCAPPLPGAAGGGGGGAGAAAEGGAQRAQGM